MSVTAALNAKGGSDAGGGSVTILSDGAIIVMQPIDVSGEFDGGDVDLEAQTTSPAGQRRRRYLWWKPVRLLAVELDSASATSR